MSPFDKHLTATVQTLYFLLHIGSSCCRTAEQIETEIRSNVVGCRRGHLSQAVLGSLHQGRGGHCSESGDGDYVGDGDERRNH